MKQYRNSERTKKWIRRAFAELAAEKKSLSKITVSDLAARADITKTTFYYHYDDIYAVVEEVENELIEKLNATLENILVDSPDDYTAYIREILSFIRENEENYRLATNVTDLTLFSEKLKKIFTKRIVSIAPALGFSEDCNKRTVQVYFFVSACVDTILQYLKGNLPVSLELVGEVITETIDRLKKNP